MLEHITSLEELEKEAIEIEKILEGDIPDDINVIVGVGSQLSVFIARTGKMVADAKYHKDEALKSSIIQTLKDSAAMAGLSITTINKLIDANCTVPNYMVTWCDRLNRTATHQLEWCRTLVSKAKEEMRSTPGVSGQSNRNSY